MLNGEQQHLKIDYFELSHTQPIFVWYIHKLIKYLSSRVEDEQTDKNNKNVSKKLLGLHPTNQ